MADRRRDGHFGGAAVRGDVVVWRAAPGGPEFLLPDRARHGVDFEGDRAWGTPAGDGAAARCRPAVVGETLRASGARVSRVVLYSAAGCHLCDAARDVLERVGRDVPFELSEVDITGVPQLEAAHREWLPVVEIDGERAFVYFVPEDTLRRRLGAQSSS